MRQLFHVVWCGSVCVNESIWKRVFVCFPLSHCYEASNTFRYIFSTNYAYNHLNRHNVHSLDHTRSACKSPSKSLLCKKEQSHITQKKIIPLIHSIIFFAHHPILVHYVTGHFSFIHFSYFVKFIQWRLN